MYYATLALLTILLLTLFIEKYSSASKEENVVSVDISRASHELLAPNPSKAPNGYGSTASDEVQESAVVEKPSLEQADALKTLLEVDEDTNDEYNWISETFYRKSSCAGEDSVGTDELLAEQAQFQAEDQSFTVADDRFPDDGVERPMEEYDSTDNSEPPTSSNTASVITNTNDETIAPPLTEDVQRSSAISDGA